MAPTILGIDRGGADDIVVTTLVAQVQQIAVGTLETPMKPSWPTLAVARLTAQAGTVMQAFYILNGATTRRLDLRHLRSIVVGEELARDGLEPVLMELVRTPLARGSSSLFQARGMAIDILAALDPMGEVNPSRMAEGYILQAKQLHLAPPVRMHHFINRLAGGVDPYLPVLAINQHASAELLIPQASGKVSALPGELPRTGGNPVEMVGTAIYKQDKLAGYLNVDETQMLLAVRGEMGKSYISFPDPDLPLKSITTRFHQENLPQYRATFQENQPHVNVHLLFESEVLGVPGGTDYTQAVARERLQKASEAYVNRTMQGLLEKLHKWDADPVGFSLLFRGQFANWKAWEQYDWHSHVNELTVNVSSTMRTRRYGLLLGRDRVNQIRR